jgi:hypothetical protein
MDPKRIDKLIWLDPNLTSNYGHPIEGAFSIKEYAQKTRGNTVEIVANKNADIHVKRLLGNIHPLITNTCYQCLENEGETFSHDLEKAKDLFPLNENDLIIIPTAYTNEIHGVKAFLKNNPDHSPKIALQIHQLLPPGTTFYHTLTKKYLQRYVGLLQKSLCGAAEFRQKLTLWTTESHRLNSFINAISPIPIGKLPLAVQFHEEFRRFVQKNKKPLTISFLGDGRFEKGLIIFMKAITGLGMNGQNIVIQDYNSRGYRKCDEREKDIIRRSLDRMPNVEFVETSIDIPGFQKAIAESDIMILPYHPLSYGNRISEVYIISRMHNRFCVVSSGTWMAEESEKYETGLIFDYDIYSRTATIENLQKALWKAKDMIEMHESNESDQPEHYVLKNNPERIIDIILDQYETQ